MLLIITTDSGAETIVPFDEYREEVFAFADQVEAFYDSQPPREPAEEDAPAYRAFWEEWHRRRHNNPGSVYQRAFPGAATA